MSQGISPLVCACARCFESVCDDDVFSAHTKLFAHTCSNVSLTDRNFDLLKKTLMFHLRVVTGDEPPLSLPNESCYLCSAPAVNVCDLASHEIMMASMLCSLLHKRASFLSMRNALAKSL